VAVVYNGRPTNEYTALDRGGRAGIGVPMTTSWMDLRSGRCHSGSSPTVCPPLVSPVGRNPRADGCVTVKDETGPSRAGMDVCLGQRLHDRRDQVFLFRMDPQTDRGVEVVRSDLFQTECARHA
jgi:hypothetical protein